MSQTEYESIKKYIIRKRKKREKERQETETGYCLDTALEHACVCVSIFRNVSKHLWLNQHDIRFGENMWCAVIQHRAVSMHQETQSANYEGGLSLPMPSCLCGLPLVLFGSFPNITEFFFCDTELWLSKDKNNMMSKCVASSPASIHYGAVYSAMLILHLHRLL